MQHFPFIDMEGKKYPPVVMGEDRFTDWFSRGLHTTELERARIYQGCLETAYGLGVRGFSISPHKTLMDVLKRFKEENKDIVCISNHHWQTHYYLDKESLWSQRNLKRLAATVATKVDSQIRAESPVFRDIDLSQSFSQAEIKDIRLDEQEYNQQLRAFSTFCDFCLVGNLGFSALALLDRQDILKKEITLARKAGLIPLGMCEGGGLALPIIEKLDVAGSWVLINRDYCCPTLKYAIPIIRNSKKPITGYRVLSGSQGFNIEKSIRFIQSIKEIKSIVIGVENEIQAKETFSTLRQLWN